MNGYRVFFDGTQAVDVQAEKINTGQNWLWFFDAEDNLVAMFRWASIHGFAVEGSETGQIITTRIPVTMGKVAPEEMDAYWRVQQGEASKVDEGTEQAVINPTRLLTDSQ